MGCVCICVSNDVSNEPTCQTVHKHMVILIKCVSIHGIYQSVVVVVGLVAVVEGCGGSVLVCVCVCMLSCVFIIGAAGCCAMLGSYLQFCCRCCWFGCVGCVTVEASLSVKKSGQTCLCA